MKFSAGDMVQIKGDYADATMAFDGRVGTVVSVRKDACMVDVIGLGMVYAHKYNLELCPAGDHIPKRKKSGIMDLLEYFKNSDSVIIRVVVQPGDYRNKTSLSYVFQRAAKRYHYDDIVCVQRGGEVYLIKRSAVENVERGN